jgi:peptide chain release factor subunit 3
VKLRLAGIDDESIVQKGNVICNRDASVPISELFIAEVKILTLLEHKPIFSSGYKSMMHIHTIQEECQLKEIDILYEETEHGVTQKAKPKFCTSGQTILCKISMQKPICFEKFDTIEQMGRFTLRDDGKTIALGKIVKYKPAYFETNTDGLNEEQRKQVEDAKKIQME